MCFTRTSAKLVNAPESVLIFSKIHHKNFYDFLVFPINNHHPKIFLKKNQNRKTLLIHLHCLYVSYLFTGAGKSNQRTHIYNTNKYIYFLNVKSICKWNIISHEKQEIVFVQKLLHRFRLVNTIRCEKSKYFLLFHKVSS